MTGSLSSVSKIGCARVLLSPPGIAKLLVDLQFVDDQSIILVLAEKGYFYASF